MNDTIYSNGITIEGKYALEAMDVDQLDSLLRHETPLPKKLFDEMDKRTKIPKDKLGVKAGIDPKDIGSAGWGIIFADDDPQAPQIQKALEPLIDLRKQQASERFRMYDGELGFRKSKSETRESFLRHFGVGPGPADPDRCEDVGLCVPYYLLIVGSPDTIPYSFQSELDLQYAVGRIHFDRLEDYRIYAESVVTAEENKVKLPRQATFFGVGNPVSGLPGVLEPATKAALEFLVDPLVKTLTSSQRYKGWQIDSVLREAATKEQLKRRLGGNATPALLFMTSHGLDIAASEQPNLALSEYQGALICAEYVHNQPVPLETIFAGKDLRDDPSLNLLGLIAFFNACFGAGTPQFDAYSRLHNELNLAQPGQERQLTTRPFVADLPRRMLSAHAGGALAVISHVERTWSSTFLWKTAEDGSLPAQTAAFESTLFQLMHGFPVGSAMEYLNGRYQELTALLQPYLHKINSGEEYDRLEFCKLWMAAIDAQWYTIVGDPAVRLPVVDESEAQPRPLLVSTAATTAGSGGSPPGTPSDADATIAGAVSAIPSKANPASPPKEETMATSTESDPRFAHIYSPAPAPTKELTDLKTQHKDLYDAYIAHVKGGYDNNARVFDEVRRAFMRSHNFTVAMYWILFLVGVGTVIVGIVLALRGEAVTGAVFLGVGVAAFVTYFISRSTLSIEENLLYITWLGVIYNSYWTHLAWATQRNTAQAELDKATVDAIAQLERLVDRHARSVKGRPNIGGSASPPAPPTPPADAANPSMPPPPPAGPDAANPATAGES